MNSIAIPVSALSPHYKLPTLAELNHTPQTLLLGQERVLNAFELLCNTPNQHMFLADFASVDRVEFIKSLITSKTKPAEQYLYNIESHDNQCTLNWSSTETDNETFSCKNQTYQYLSGDIKRSDLLGRFIDDKQKSSADNYTPGALTKCHYLFICAESLWKREGLWELLLNILVKREFKVHSSLPALPLNCKIILIGSSIQFSVCWVEETRFPQLFPILGEMVNELDLVQYSETEYATWLIAVAANVNTQLHQSILAPLFIYSARLADHQLRFSLLSGLIGQMLAQAKAYSVTERITAEDFSLALKQQQFRHSASEMLSAQNFDDKFISLPTDGFMVGQINALTVLDTVEYCYGEPARITASVHYGDGEVADIERKSELAGNIHAKGMMILSACLYRIFGKDAPLHLNANIVFEQSYQEIDGDSASLAEYCSLISAIAEKPIDQSIAVTGALDQFGHVQAIGGVNEKIEGFYNLCARRGLTGRQGVIIPKSNTQQLNLDIKIIESVKAGKFHLYAIEHIDEAVELLMSLKAGTPDEDNDFPDDSLYGIVQDRLAKLAGYQDEETGFFAKLLEKMKFSS
ncbi:AAA family ATPase [Shewanella sp. D64]|uniref:S16 family serine protease n=1 Tax=unclassified Shewanella TaxID=196818 RepID=UPI0022BA3114|nr:MULTISPECIES: S16 family serine protease [unclassified Shewanella]MEC4724312.1 AAA family ATPase [Shewanella sp. D64]MEC4738824.1 AAA family ATPase [Shewanella sp. E94]WBJ97737.1 AAA family ATPase [Shewanella sp. MTB7]